MKEQITIPYHVKFSFLYRCKLELRLAPYFAYHFVLRPYRQSVPAIGYAKPHVSGHRRRRDALYDAMFKILLECYAHVTGLRVHVCTGQMLYFLSSLLASFDEILEKRLWSEESLAFHDIMAEPSVQERLHYFRCYLQLFGCAEKIITHLQQVFDQHYETYIYSLKAARSELRFEHVLTSIHFDSGIELCCLMEIAALFNSATLPQQAREEFYCFGMVGKFADDWIDIVRDINKDSPNLIYALVSQYPEELAVLKLATQQRKRLSASWWRKHCPATYALYFEHITHLYNQIQSSCLLLACDLVILPAIIGYDYDSPKWKT